MSWEVVLKDALLYGGDLVIGGFTYQQAETQVDGMRSWNAGREFWIWPYFPDVREYQRCTGIYMRPRVHFGKRCPFHSRRF